MGHTHNTGFTLLELLIVIAVVGILATIAIPEFARYRALSYCSVVEADVRNTVLGYEGHYTNTGSYSSYTPVTSEDVFLFKSVLPHQLRWIIAFRPNCPQGFFLFLGATGQFRWSS